MAGVFPKEFVDLETVGGPWAIVSYEQRHEKLSRSSREHLEAFYDAVMPRAPDILTYCNSFDLRNSPREVQALLNLLMALIDISLPVETWRRAAETAQRPADLRQRRGTSRSRRKSQSVAVCWSSITLPSGSRP